MFQTLKISLLIAVVIAAVAGSGLFFIKFLRNTIETKPDAPAPTTVGEFKFIDQSRKPVSHNDLLGKVWIANFIFTRCAGPCPIMTHSMRKLQDELPPEVDFISISVDPDYDTPEILQEYASKYKADLSRWRFLTGDKKAIYSLARNFKLTTVKSAESEEQFIHSTRYIIIDKRGQARGMPMIVGNDLTIDKIQLNKLRQLVKELLVE